MNFYARLLTYATTFSMKTHRNVYDIMNDMDSETRLFYKMFEDLATSVSKNSNLTPFQVMDIMEPLPAGISWSAFDRFYSGDVDKNEFKNISKAFDILVSVLDCNELVRLDEMKEFKSNGKSFQCGRFVCNEKSINFLKKYIPIPNDAILHKLASSIHTQDPVVKEENNSVTYKYSSAKEAQDLENYILRWCSTNDVLCEFLPCKDDGRMEVKLHPTGEKCVMEGCSGLAVDDGHCKSISCIDRYSNTESPIEKTVSAIRKLTSEEIQEMEEVVDEIEKIASDALVLTEEDVSDSELEIEHLDDSSKVEEEEVEDVEDDEQDVEEDEEDVEEEEEDAVKEDVEEEEGVEEEEEETRAKVQKLLEYMGSDSEDESEEIIQVKRNTEKSEWVRANPLLSELIFNEKWTKSEKMDLEQLAENICEDNGYILDHDEHVMLNDKKLKEKGGRFYPEYGVYFSTHHKNFVKKIMAFHDKFEAMNENDEQLLKFVEERPRWKWVSVIDYDQFEYVDTPTITKDTTFFVTGKKELVEWATSRLEKTTQPFPVPEHNGRFRIKLSSKHYKMIYNVPDGKALNLDTCKYVSIDGREDTEGMMTDYGIYTDNKKLIGRLDELKNLLFTHFMQL